MFIGEGVVVKTNRFDGRLLAAEWEGSDYR